MIKINEPTRYEIEARHEDGRAYLICYSAGSPSLRRLVAAVGARGPEIAAALGIPANTDFDAPDGLPLPRWSGVASDHAMGRKEAEGPRAILHGLPQAR